MTDPDTSQHPGLAEDGAEDPAAYYGSYYYRHDCGLPYERNEHWLTFFGELAENIVRSLHPSSVLDAGCAMGFLVEALRRNGVEAWGIDVSEYAISQVHESVRDYCSVGSLTDPLPRRYDLITCIEVVEHIPAADTPAVISNLCQATDRLLLSTSPFDYGEATHVNVRSPGDWSALLAREGFLRDLNHDASYLTPWAVLYTRTEEPFTETVRRYDEAWWRLRHEVSEMRSSLLTLHERLDGLYGAKAAQRPEFMVELERSKEEVLRLRDLLIGKDIELGAISGRLAELEDASRRSLIARGLRARLNAAMHRLIALLRGPRA